MLRCPSSIREGSFETSLASEVIEHIPRPEGFKLISECERVTKKVVIITTPSPRTVNLSPDHISLWKLSDFRRLAIISTVLKVILD